MVQRQKVFRRIDLHGWNGHEKKHDKKKHDRNFNFKPVDVVGGSNNNDFVERIRSIITPSTNSSSASSTTARSVPLPPSSNNSTYSNSSNNSNTSGRRRNKNINNKNRYLYIIMLILILESLVFVWYNLYQSTSTTTSSTDENYYNYNNNNHFYYSNNQNPQASFDETNASLFYNTFHSNLLQDKQQKQEQQSLEINPGTRKGSTNNHQLDGKKTTSSSSSYNFSLLEQIRTVSACRGYARNTFGPLQSTETNETLKEHLKAILSASSERSNTIDNDNNNANTIRRRTYRIPPIDSPDYNPMVDLNVTISLLLAMGVDRSQLQLVTKIPENNSINNNDSTTMERTNISSSIPSLPLWSEVVENNYASDPPIILGLERCTMYRNSVPANQRMVGAAGLFSTGTNALSRLLSSNCIMPYSHPTTSITNNDSDSDSAMTTPTRRNRILAQVPWGKHNPESARLYHAANKYEHHNQSAVLPIVMIRHPYTWMYALCKHPYVLRWPHSKERCDKRLSLRQNVTSSFAKYPTNKKFSSAGLSSSESSRHDNNNNTSNHNNKNNNNSNNDDNNSDQSSGSSNNSNATNNKNDGDDDENINSPSRYNKNTYPSLLHVWIEWNLEFFVQTNYPLLMIRLEDIVYHPKGVITSICHCVGGTMRHEQQQQQRTTGSSTNQDDKNKKINPKSRNNDYDNNNNIDGFIYQHNTANAGPGHGQRSDLIGAFSSFGKPLREFHQTMFSKMDWQVIHTTFAQYYYNDDTISNDNNNDRNYNETNNSNFTTITSRRFERRGRRRKKTSNEKMNQGGKSMHHDDDDDTKSVTKLSPLHEMIRQLGYKLYLTRKEQKEMKQQRTEDIIITVNEIAVQEDEGEEEEEEIDDDDVVENDDDDDHYNKS